MSQIATSTSTAVVIANSNANLRKDILCQSVIDDYKHDPQDISSMQTFSDCVQRLHPQEMPFALAIGIKLSIIFTFAFVLYRIIKDRFDDPIYVAFESLCISLAVLIVASVFAGGVFFLFY